MKKLTITLGIILFVLSNALAQLGEIKGIVKDKETGEPIFNASVYVKVGDNLIGDVTDFDGKFSIKPLSPGKYTVTSKIQGFQTVIRQDVLVTSDNITFTNFDLLTSVEELPEFKLEEFETDIIDKAEPYVQHVYPEQLKNTVYRHDPVKIATTLPGVTLAPNGKDVYIRGARPQSTQFITDGMKSITGDIGIPGQAVGSIKVYTGGVPARYGDVTGGVIVVETKSYFDLAQDFMK